MQIIFFSRSVYEQHHLPLPKNIAMQNLKQVHSQHERLKVILKEQFKVLLQGTMHFHLLTQSKEYHHTGNSFCMMYWIWLSS